MTSEAKVRLELVERQLDRTHQFFPRIDSKVTALFAVASGQIAVAAINLSSDDLKQWWISMPLVAFLLIIGWAMINLYRCAYPQIGRDTSELQSLMRISYAVFCLKKK